MAINLKRILKEGKNILSFPPIRIRKRESDLSIEYNMHKNRLDRISNDIYGDPTYWKIILWANPQYFMEFDIPDNTVIRVPYPFEEVESEVYRKLQQGKYRESLQ